MVPNSTPNNSNFKIFPHGQSQRGYYIGAGTTHPQREEQKHVTLEIRNLYETDVAGILNVAARLIIGSGTWYYRVHDANFTDARMWGYDPFPSYVTFSLDGFWSESSGKLYMVGKETGRESPQLQLLEVVLKLHNVFNSSSTIYTLVTGSLESVSPENEASYFEPISVFIFPRVNYEYSLDAKEAKNDYSDEDELVKVLIGFGNIDPSFSWSFNPNSTLVGEGWWDEEKNQFSIVGCYFLGMKESMASIHVGDCSTRMSLRFPKIWSINDASSIIGQIWSNMTLGDSGYFKRMNLRSQQHKRHITSGIKYEYSQLYKVRKLCQRQESVKNKWISYPDVYSSDMILYIYAEYFSQKVAWGYSVPFVVDDQIQQMNLDENFGYVPFIVNEQRVSMFRHTQPFISAISSSAGMYNVSY
ncbi:hypothetical protein VNO78_06447 [Psophocarpus tetragonolobus]|uniref:DUF2921 domain-containing protein n=1 Tax=Psophocarpus tetragonolobus TaxID=3891 RepID=A0AAN9XRL6_PSOTE